MTTAVEDRNRQLRSRKIVGRDSRARPLEVEQPPDGVYKNSRLVNFVYKESQEQMQSALRDVRNRFGRKFPLVINGEKIWTDKLNAFRSIPVRPMNIVGYAAEAGIPGSRARGQSRRAVVRSKSGAALHLKSARAVAGTRRRNSRPPPV